ncbi:DUF2782 domain-containing protein [Methylotuvimicrobium alcaliphilum]|nr:DUF2782 domain-containing protein [Methylotuvimicrobium alcaliphilum]
MMRLTLTYTLLIIPAFALSAPPPILMDIPDVPDMPATVQSGQVMEPDRTVIRRSKETTEAIPELPDAPMPVESGEPMEPDITIIRRGKEQIQEYRINGELYMIKIVPDIGPAYYLIDTDGDGNMDVRESDLHRGTRINQWKLLEWN